MSNFTFSRMRDRPLRDTQGGGLGVGEEGRREGWDIVGNFPNLIKIHSTRSRAPEKMWGEGRIESQEK